MKLRNRLALSVCVIAVPWACSAAQVTPEQRVELEVLALQQACGAALASGAPLSPEVQAVGKAFVKPASIGPSEGPTGDAG